MKRFFNLISIFAFLFSCDSGLDNQENKYEVTIEQSCGFDKDVINKKDYAFASGAIMTYLDEPKTVELKGAIFGGFKFSIIMLVITIVTDNFSSFNKKKE